MKATITRQELKVAVTGLSKVVDVNATLPAISHAKLMAGKNGVSIMGTNLDEYAEYRFTDAEAQGAGSVLVSLAALKGLTKGADSDKIAIASGKDSVGIVNHIGSQEINRTYECPPLEDWPATVVSAELKPVPGFLEAFRFVMPCTGRDETRKYLNGVYLDVGNKEAGQSSLVATDGRRLVYSNSATLGLDESVNVKATPFLGWTKLAGYQEIGTAKKWFLMGVGQWRYWAKLIEGTYPNYRHTIPTEVGANKVVFTDEDVKFLLSVQSIFPTDAGVEISQGKEGSLKLTGKNGSDNEPTVIETANGTTFTGTETIRLANAYFIDALNAGFRVLTFSDGWTPCVFAQDTRKLIIMPLRPQGNAPAPATVKVIQESGVSTEQKPEASKPEVTPVEAPKQEPAGIAQTITSPEPVVVPVQDATKPAKEKKMAEKTEAAVESGLAKVEAIIEAARVKIRELNVAINDVASELKAMAKDMKAQDKEVESVRATLQKLQSMKL